MHHACVAPDDERMHRSCVAPDGGRYMSRMSAGSAQWWAPALHFETLKVGRLPWAFGARNRARFRCPTPEVGRVPKFDKRVHELADKPLLFRSSIFTALLAELNTTQPSSA
ncbi:hypothetical protein HPP92_004841 [Vanilla planifolia]|uniref:Uncharacterized protein n=1 Tax=Vanilla planifolia TaxID=51239 RepID=A0A835RYA0_VANPL|nr:hypothetical protein HPP92_005204 [Vanilla planifolia]KAG0493847.1 hypothetical protein HPP92_004841 [Vanilla planifolia]